MSLVEVMVAVAISLMLMAGIIQLFVSNQVSYSTQTGLSRIQENSRFALEILEQNIMMAGYTLADTPITPFVAAGTLNNRDANSVIGTTTTIGNASDRIQIASVTGNDCLSVAVAGGETSQFYLAASNNISNLMCLGSGSATPQPLIEGIESMQFLYGEDTDNDDVPNFYRNAANVTNWNNIKTVRITLLVSTFDDSAEQDTATHVLLDAPPIGPVNDQAIRKVFTKTVKVRN